MSNTRIKKLCAPVTQVLGLRRQEDAWDLLAGSLTPQSEKDHVSKGTRQRRKQQDTRHPSVISVGHLHVHTGTYTTHTKLKQARDPVSRRALMIWGGKPHKGGGGMWVDGWSSQGEGWEGSQEGQGCHRQRETEQPEAAAVRRG